MKKITTILLIIINSWCLFGQMDTIWFSDSLECAEYGALINRPNGYPRQNAWQYQDCGYDSTKGQYYHLINPVSEKGLNEPDTIWSPFMKLTEGDTIWHEGDKWYIRQSHFSSMLWVPEIVPALYYKVRGSDTLNWVKNEYVLVGYVRIYGGVNYEVIQEHLTQIGWEPPNVPNLYEEILSGCTDYDPWTVYSIDECVIFNGEEYISLIDLNSWSPTGYPQGWELK